MMKLSFALGALLALPVPTFAEAISEVGSHVFNKVRDSLPLPLESRHPQKEPARMASRVCEYQSFAFTSDSIPAYRYTITLPTCGGHIFRATPYSDSYSAEFDVDGYPAHRGGGVSDGEFVVLYLDDYRIDLGFEYFADLTLEDYVSRIDIQRQIAK